MLAQQTWPPLYNLPQIVSFTAKSISPSSSIIKASFPPSSSITCVKFCEAVPIVWIPAPVLPVRETRDTPLCLANAWPTIGPSPVTTWITPAGTPASTINLTYSINVNGL